MHHAMGAPTPTPTPSGKNAFESVCSNGKPAKPNFDWAAYCKQTDCSKASSKCDCDKCGPKIAAEITSVCKKENYPCFDSAQMAELSKAGESKASLAKLCTGPCYKAIIQGDKVTKDDKKTCPAMFKDNRRSLLPNFMYRFPNSGLS